MSLISLLQTEIGFSVFFFPLRRKLKISLIMLSWGKVCCVVGDLFTLVSLLFTLLFLSFSFLLFVARDNSLVEDFFFFHLFILFFFLSFSFLLFVGRDCSLVGDFFFFHLFTLFFFLSFFLSFFLFLSFLLSFCSESICPLDLNNSDLFFCEIANKRIGNF